MSVHCCVLLVLPNGTRFLSLGSEAVDGQVLLVRSI